MGHRRSRWCRRKRWLAGLLTAALAAAPLLTPVSGWPPDRRADAAPLAGLERRALEHTRKGEYAAATSLFREALDLCRKLYPAKAYPRGHTDLARGLDHLGAVLLEQGELGQAGPYLHKALAMREKLYPSRSHPRGHPDIARSLTNVGGLLRARGELARAWRYHEEALAMYRKL
jgi:tetratricopeptide (TPR) repeat protein